MKFRFTLQPVELRKIRHLGSMLRALDPDASEFFIISGPALAHLERTLTVDADLETIRLGPL